MTKPDFIIIGAAKSGTTTLYQYLCRHPQIYMSTPKEPDFFSLDKNYAQGIEWYESLFNQAQPNQICGEASTTYSRYHQHPFAAERIAKHLSNVKLIYVMRHPIDRAYSFYTYRFRRSQYNQKFLAERNELMTARTFEEAIEKQTEFIDSSYYLEQIEKYLKFFPKESFLFILMEDLIEHPGATLNQIFRFLNVEENFDVLQKGEIFANQAENDAEKAFRQQIFKSIQKIPLVSYVGKFMTESIKSNLYTIIKKVNYINWTNQQYIPPKMLPETRQMLINKFDEPNQKLAKFIQRDLSHWNQ